jgi:hypothetical protein
MLQEVKSMEINIKDLMFFTNNNWKEKNMFRKFTLFGCRSSSDESCKAGFESCW